MKLQFEIEAKSGRFIRTGDLPFVPSLGMMVDIENGNYREVKGVYLKSDQILIWLDDNGDSTKFLKKWGWRRSDK